MLILTSKDNSWIINVNRYFSKRAPYYNKMPVIWRWLRSKESQSVLAALTLAESDRVLEIGCGSGFYSNQMSSQVKEVTAIDENLKMVEAFRCVGVQAEHRSMESFESTEKYDKILIAGVLEFCEVPEEILKKSVGLLKEGGRLVILIPKRGLIGFAYKLVHRMWGCPCHSPGKLLKKLSSMQSWCKSSAGPLAICMFLDKNGPS